MANPKIEFFRFKLKHKTADFKTFRDFMVENGKCKKEIQKRQFLVSYLPIS